MIKRKQYLQDLNPVLVAPNQELHNHLLSEEEDVTLSTLPTTPYARSTPVAQLLLVVTFDRLPILSVEDPDQRIWSWDVDDQIPTVDVVNGNSDLRATSLLMRLLCEA